MSLTLTRILHYGAIFMQQQVQVLKQNTHADSKAF